ncbi:MAG TPA: hypothetical protein VL493_10305 [Candidatus Saccharimonadales bacterium]|jgi:hypothetical protein|nr:hypothetical protein [Candidatus Saccharimonadales bacterium]
MFEPEGETAFEVPAPGAAVFAAPVIRLRPIRTLVIARDLAFRERSMTVLVELGYVAFAVTPLEEADAVVALVARQRADVVVLDATGCAGAVARVVAALYESAPRAGVVVVSGTDDRVAHTMPVLAKWGWAADLTRAVAAAYDQGSPLNEDNFDVHN